MTTQTFICPNCFKVTKIETSIPTINIVENSVGEIIEKGHNFEVRCKECDELMFECDTSIADYVVKMNKNLGLKTLYCCKGHFHKDIVTHNFAYFSVPYIKFTAQNIRQLSNSLIAAYKAREDENAEDIITIDALLQNGEEGLAVDIRGSIDMVDSNDIDKADKVMIKFAFVLKRFIAEYEKILEQEGKIGVQYQPTNNID